MLCFSDRAHAIRDIDDLATQEIFLECLFDDFDTEEDETDCNGEPDLDDTIILDLESIALICDILFSNRYLSRRLPIEKDTLHTRILFAGSNTRQFQTLFC